MRTIATLLVVGGLGYTLYFVMSHREAPRPVVITTVPTKSVTIERAQEVSPPLPLPPLPPLPPFPPIDPDPAPTKVDPTTPRLRGPEDVKPVRPLKSGKSLVKKDAPPPRVVPRRPASPRAAPAVPQRESNWSTTIKIAQHTNPPSPAQINIITGQRLIWPGDARF